MSAKPVLLEGIRVVDLTTLVFGRYADDACSRIFALLDQPTFLEQDHLSTPQLRARAQPELYQAIASFSVALPVSEILQRCHAAQIPAQAVRDLSDIMDDPHLRNVEFFRPRERPVEGRYFEQATPVKFAVSSDGKQASPPPLVGGDSEEIRVRGWSAFSRTNDG